MASDNHLPDTGYLRIKQVLQYIPFSKSTLWAGMKTGRFPRPVNLGGRITAWHAGDIRHYIDSLKQQ